MILVDHPFRHCRGGEGQVVTLDDLAEQIGVRHAHCAGANHGDRPFGAVKDFAGLHDVVVRCGRNLQRRYNLRHAFGRGRDRDVFRQIEMDRTLRFRHRKADRSGERLRDLALLEPERALGDRLEQRVMVDPHLDTAAELFGDEIAGNGDHRRAVEPRVADAGREIGRAWTERGDAQPRRAGDAAGDVGGKARGALVRGQHEIDAALAHRLHQREHVAARDAEAAVDACGLERGDNQIGVVH